MHRLPIESNVKRLLQMSFAATRVNFAAAALIVLLAAGSTADANPASVALSAKAFEHAYNLDHREAVETFKQAIAADPMDPVARRSLAATTWLNILFKRGAVQVDDYLGNITRSKVFYKPPDPEQAALFRENADRALQLAERLVRSRPRDADSHYQLGATVGLMASYSASVDGHILGALGAARRAYMEHERVVQLDARRKDAGLVLGVYRIAVSALAMPLRWMAYLVGFESGREIGLRMVEEAAAYPSEAQTEARFALILLYNRSGRFDDALQAIEGLRRLYPRNRLLWLEAGSTALRAGRAADAEAMLTEGMNRLREDTRPRAFGEEARWHYKRGAARVALGRRDAALDDLQAALSGEAPDWVRGRVYVELGKLADLGGDRGRALAHYEKAITSCEKDGDRACVEEAWRLKRTAYRR